MILQQRLSSACPSAVAARNAAARQHKDSKSFTRVDSCKLFYMDVGVWGGGPDGNAKTTFGLICGHDILLCSWLNLTEGGVDPYSEYAQVLPEGRFDLSAGTKQFFETAGPKRGFVVYSTRSEELLTEPGQPLIVVPDLHIHLYKGELIDRFQYYPSDRTWGIPGERKFEEMAREKGLIDRNDALAKYYKEALKIPLTSLDEELAHMLEVAKNCSADTVQVGDMYEVWEAEVLLRNQYREMEWYQKVASGTDIRTDMGKMLATKKVVPRYLQRYLLEYETRLAILPDWAINQFGVDFTLTRDICDAIRKTHPALFQGGDGSNLFKYQLEGNHDNLKINFYWIYSGPYPEDEVLRQGTISGTRHPYSEINQQIGTPDHRIHIEHGHRYDWHNNDDNWWKKDAGFDNVFDFLLGTKGALAGWEEGSNDGMLFTGGQKGREFADRWSEIHDYDMRKPGCRAADEAFGTSPSKASDSKVRLFIQGHTHDPQLWMIPVRCSLAELLPGWRSYVLGKYWWGKEPYPKHDQYEREYLEEQGLSQSLAMPGG